MHRHPAPRERKRNATRPDSELERPSGSGTLDEEVDDRLDDRRIELLTVRLVVARRDALVEVAVVVHAPKSSRLRKLGDRALTYLSGGVPSSTTPRTGSLRRGSTAVGPPANLHAGSTGSRSTSPRSASQACHIGESYLAAGVEKSRGTAVSESKPAARTAARRAPVSVTMSSSVSVQFSSRSRNVSTSQVGTASAV